MRRSIGPRALALWKSRYTTVSESWLYDSTDRCFHRLRRRVLRAGLPAGDRPQPSSRSARCESRRLGLRLQRTAEFGGWFPEQRPANCWDRRKPCRYERFENLALRNRYTQTTGP